MTPQSLIRNFSIIAHIDHGKTTLTDSLLKLTNTVSALKFQERMMDSNPIEQEKGVTIKLAPVRMNYQYEGKNYILNLIDTPGHVDFGYEVNRSLAACEGALLLIDASQGIQAQTLANYHKAKELNLKIIPVINKIDLPTADIDKTMLECLDLLEFKEEEFLLVSAKTGQGVDKVLETIVKQFPSPAHNTFHQQDSEKIASDATAAADQPLRGLVITSIFDNHLGAVAYVRIVNGVLDKRQLHLLSNQTSFNPVEIGIFSPQRVKKEQLFPGEVGYVATGLKNSQLIKIGDTVTTFQDRNITKALPGYKEPSPMVYMELFPIDTKDYSDLKDSMEKLRLHDSALQFAPTHSVALGNGLRVGFLGIFHAEIVRERLTREFNLDLIATAPSVKYKIETKTEKELTINNPEQLPDPSELVSINEPIAKVTIFSPEKYQGSILKLMREKRGQFVNSKSSGMRMWIEYRMPLAELITDFHDQLKSITSGYASLEYELDGYQYVNAVKVNVLVNHEIVEALSFISVEEDAEQKGRKLVSKLKDVIPKQLFEIPIQAAIGGKIIARETISAYRKDVTAKLYGGDRTRRMKLLQKQSKGKKKMKQIGKVELNQEAFLAVLKN